MKRVDLIILFLVMLLGAIVAMAVGLVSAAGVVVGPNGTVFWTANTDTDLAGYKIYFGQAPGVYSVSSDIGKTATPTNPLVSISTFNLSEGQWYVAVTAYDLAENESGKSVEVPFVFDHTGPGTPIGVGVNKQAN